MGEIIAVIVLAPIYIALMIWGILLIMGKAYRSIAGNQYASEEEINAQKQNNLGKVIGGGMILIAFVLAVQLVLTFVK